MDSTKFFGEDRIPYSDFYYANSDINESSEKCLNTYCFNNKVFKNNGRHNFSSFSNEICKEENILDLGFSLINLEKVTTIEILHNKFSFRFYFENSELLECEAPDDLKSKLKFNALSQIIMEAFSDIEKSRLSKDEISFTENLPDTSSRIEFH